MAAMEQKQARITERLLTTTDISTYQFATQHPFLQAARARTLNSDLLALWLSQDRIYAAHAYPRFIGTLISKIPFSSHHKIGSPQELKNQRILSVLSYSLENVVREARFFLDTAEKYGFDLECWRERSAMRDYCAEMARVASWGSLEEGLVFLWAMEKLYLDSWSFVAENFSNQNDSPASRAVTEFAKNWTNEEFVKYVEDLRILVDDLDVRPDPESEIWNRMKQACDRVVELEIDFWPREGEEVRGRVGR